MKVNNVVEPAKIARAEELLDRAVVAEGDRDTNDRVKVRAARKLKSA